MGSGFKAAIYEVVFTFKAKKSGSLKKIKKNILSELKPDIND